MGRSIAGACAVTCVAACGGGSGSGTAPAGPGLITLGEPVAYVGTSNACVQSLANCLRAPDTDGNFVTIAQPGNASNFAISSADPTIAVGALVMRGPGGAGDPAIALEPQKAGSTVLTVTGAGGATASVPITVTTVSSVVVNVRGFPTASALHFVVSAPAGSPCPGFQGGYSFDWNFGGASITLRNFPAMGAGASPACVFSNVDVGVVDSTGVTLTDKTFVALPITIGQDNPLTLNIP